MCFARWPVAPGGPVAFMASQNSAPGELQDSTLNRMNKGLGIIARLE
jgi:hypothetical protein